MSTNILNEKRKKYFFFSHFLFHLSTSFIIFVLHKLKENATSPIYLDINNNKSVITALKAGEEKVFDVVYRHYFRRLCAFCSQYVSEQEEIEEIVQETMIVACGKTVLYSDGRSDTQNSSFFYDCQEQSPQRLPILRLNESTSGNRR